jgi:nitrogen-specific signal transduction histidine kinase
VLVADVLTVRVQQDRRDSADVLQRAEANIARAAAQTDRIRALIERMNALYQERLDGRRRK